MALNTFPSFAHHDNAGEGNVEQNDARSILGDLCAFNAYCEAHVRMRQGGSAVASIAGHRYDPLAWEDITILQHFQLAAALLSCIIRLAFKPLAKVSLPSGEERASTRK